MFANNVDNASCAVGALQRVDYGVVLTQLKLNTGVDKCYALELTNGKLKITVAGVSRKGKDGTTREEELGSIDNMISGFTFEKCGGTRADYSTIRKYEGYSGGGCAVLDTVKTIHEVLFQEGEFTFV